jgi:hypothetical protein
MSTKNELARLAAAVAILRPDWNPRSLQTLLERDHALRPLRDLAVALVWIATDPDTKTPARLSEHGPWWVATSATATGRGGEWCTVHELNSGRRPDGQLACCWVDAQPEPEPWRPTRKPIPDHIREQIHAHQPSPPALVPTRDVDRGQLEQARAELDAHRSNIPGSENPPADPSDPGYPMAGQTRKADR